MEDLSAYKYILECVHSACVFQPICGLYTFLFFKLSRSLLDSLRFVLLLLFISFFYFCMHFCFCSYYLVAFWVFIVEKFSFYTLCGSVAAVSGRTTNIKWNKTIQNWTIDCDFCYNQTYFANAIIITIKYARAQVLYAYIAIYTGLCAVCNVLRFILSAELYGAWRCVVFNWYVNTCSYQIMQYWLKKSASTTYCFARFASCDTSLNVRGGYNGIHWAHSSSLLQIIL